MNSVKVSVGYVVVRVSVWISICIKEWKIKISQCPPKEREANVCVWSPGPMPSPLLSWLLPLAESTNVV